LKTQKITQNALAGPAHRPGEKGEKNKKTSALPLLCGGYSISATNQGSRKKCQFAPKLQLFVERA
jgi:hypothetical protein